MVDWLSLVLITIGLSLFEIIISIDNAIINAEVLRTMSPKARRWFLIWGILFAVFVVRGLLPWLIVWASAPQLGFLGSFTASFSSDPAIAAIIKKSAPVLLLGGGTFLILLFLHWLFLEKKNYGLQGEELFEKHGVWFFAIASLLLVYLVWKSISLDPILALGAVIGSSAFFITHGFKENAEKMESQMIEGSSHMSDISKIFYLEIIDMTFSIDGVLGAFAFTFILPIILIGSGIGAIVVRQLTIANIENVKKYKYLKNGAMYSIGALGIVMTLHGFHVEVPEWVSPIITFSIIGFFFHKSVRALKREKRTKKRK